MQSSHERAVGNDTVEQYRISQHADIAFLIAIRKEHRSIGQQRNRERPQWSGPAYNGQGVECPESIAARRPFESSIVLPAVRLGWDTTANPVRAGAWSARASAIWRQVNTGFGSKAATHRLSPWLVVPGISSPLARAKGGPHTRLTTTRARPEKSLSPDETASRSGRTYFWAK